MEPRYLEHRASGEPCKATGIAKRRRGCGNARDATKQTYKWPGGHRRNGTEWCGCGDELLCQETGSLDGLPSKKRLRQL
ncbi:hypothetical protein MRX96_027537 [Rhipicephalus microplus]